MPHRNVGDPTPPRPREVAVRPQSVEFFSSVLAQRSMEEIHDLAVRLQGRLAGRVLWNINATSAGGGVAEMLHTLLGYARGVGIDTRWLVMGGTHDFFRVTRRLHYALHGQVGDGAPLDEAARRIYLDVTRENARHLASMVGPDDLVVLHDPHTAGLIPHLAERGNPVVWRCHIGVDTPSGESDRAWAFLEDWLHGARAFLFPRFAYIPDRLYPGRCMVVPPVIDPFSPKNHDMGRPSVLAILSHIGLIAGDGGPGLRSLSLPDGKRVPVLGRADVLREGPPPPPDRPLVVQVSRWSSLKDPVGVLDGFTRLLRLDAPEAHLVLAGPSVDEATDDPEGGEVFREVAAAWRSLPRDERRRVQVAMLPMDDVDENAVMVNALQRHAAVVVQKSLRQGFGLTVTEALWKARPVIASAVGGMQDQIEHGVSGLLLRDPLDLDALAGSLRHVLTHPGLASRLGQNGRQRVAQNYLGSGILGQLADLVERLDLDSDRSWLSEAAASESVAG